MSVPPTPFPIFLKAGYSSVLDFEEPPARVVLGDSQSFQVERLEKSLVIKTLTSYASSNMFVYFGTNEPRLFVLTASEDAEPTYYKKFETLKKLTPPPTDTPRTVLVEKTRTTPPAVRTTQVLKAEFDPKKDYLTVDVQIAAASNETMRPNWSLVRLRLGANVISPFKLWAERQDVQKDSAVKARFVFVKPAIPRDLTGVFIIVPIQGKPSPFSLALKGGSN